MMTSSNRSQLDWLVALSALPAVSLIGVMLFAAQRAPQATGIQMLDASSLNLLLGLLLACSLLVSGLLARRIASSIARTEEMLLERTAECDRGAETEAHRRGAAQRLQQLQHQASHDELTGLVNRRSFDAELQERVSACGFEGAELTLMYIDIDGFKRINDEHGHSIGDQLLRLFAARLRAGVRETEVVARLGGDEFAVILGHAMAQPALQTADALIENLSRPYRVGALRLEVSASIGLAACADSDLPAQAILEAADAAMYQAKQAGKCRHVTSDFAPL